jgi:hypothetical protein
MKQTQNEMLPDSKDTLDWIDGQIQDLCRYWDSLSCLERDITINAVGEVLDELKEPNDELMDKYMLLETKCQEDYSPDDKYPQPNISTCIDIIKTLGIIQKRRIVHEFTLVDFEGLEDHELTDILINGLNDGSYARFFSIRNHIGQYHMKSVE